MDKVYTMTVAGCKRELPVCQVDDKLDIAAFIMFGDVELTENAARELLAKCPEHDVLITAEAKGIPLCYEMARQGCRRYVVARKGRQALYAQSHRGGGQVDHHRPAAAPLSLGG